MSYAALIARRRQFGENSGFEPTWFPDKIFDFQRSMVTWACLKGRAGLGESCGLGKSLQEMTWAGLLLWLVGKAPMPEPFKAVATWIVYVVAVVALVNFLLSIVGRPFIVF